MVQISTSFPTRSSVVISCSNRTERFVKILKIYIDHQLGRDTCCGGVEQELPVLGDIPPDTGIREVKAGVSPGVVVSGVGAWMIQISLDT